MKFTKLCCITVIGISLLSGGSAYAYSDIDGKITSTDNISWNEFDPLSWNQFNADDMPESWLGHKMLDGSSGVSFPEGGDLIYVYTFLAIKTGHKMAGYIPSFANADLERMHAYANGLPHFGAEGIWSNGWHADLEPNGSQIQKNATLDSARKEFKDGKLVVLQVKNDNFTEETPYTHFIAIDSVEKDNSVKIFDSYKPSAVFTDAYSPSDVVGMITLSSDKAKSTELPKLWERRGWKDVYSKDGERDKETLGGGGGKAGKADSTYEEPKDKNKDNQSLGKYSPKDDAPVKLERGNKVKKKESRKLSVWKVVAAVVGLAIPLGGLVYSWKRKRN
jgi:hypothetical protein